MKQLLKIIVITIPMGLLAVAGAYLFAKEGIAKIENESSQAVKLFLWSSFSSTIAVLCLLSTKSALKHKNDSEKLNRIYKRIWFFDLHTGNQRIDSYNRVFILMGIFLLIALPIIIYFLATGEI